MVRAIVITVVLGACGWTAAAAAQPSPSADQLIDQGLALRGRGRDAEALALFERAYARTPTPRAQAQIALAEGALARWLAADRHLRAAIAASSDAWIAGHRQILEDALRTIDANLGGVRVTGTAAGAAVRIAGNDAGTVPMAEPVMVEPGMVTIEIARPGAVVETVEVRVAAGARVQHVADAAAPVGDTSPPPDPAPPLVVPGPEPARGSSTLSTLGAVGLGVAGAGLITGVIAHVLREAYASDFNSDPMCGTGIALPTAECQSLEASHDRAGTIAVVGYVTAGVFAAVSVVLLLAGSGDGDEAAGTERQSAIGCGLTPAGVACAF